MNIIYNNNRFQIYGDDIKTYDHLPARCYGVEFNPFSGFYLTPHEEIKVEEQKIYGSTPEKIKKVMTSYNLITRNFGVLLSGNKGAGKSLFIRLLAQEGMKSNLPVIIVSHANEGLANFISSITQDCLVIFDEFEKIFNDDEGKQTELLSLFDGIDGGHKLFLISCNDFDEISPFMLNRPGRFHYHFCLGAPSAEEIREYMMDKLEPQHYEVIDDVVSLSGMISLPYDCLRAIAFELNQGYSLKETMTDLNIIRVGRVYYDVKVYLKDGTCYEADHQYVNMLNKNNICKITARNLTAKVKVLDINVPTNFAHFVSGQYIIEDNIIQPCYSPGDFYEYPEEQRLELARTYANTNPVVKITLTKCPDYYAPRLLN